MSNNAIDDLLRQLSPARDLLYEAGRVPVTKPAQYPNRNMRTRRPRQTYLGACCDEDKQRQLLGSFD